MARQLQSVTFEDATIVFRNFSGKEGKFNREGDRNFCLLLDQETAAQMYEDGWNVKELKPREEDDSPQPYLPVAVRFSGPRPPRIVMITSRGKTPIPEEMVSILDWAEIAKVDLILNPYAWEMSGKTGVKAYTQSLYITIEEDELEKKYMDVPDSAANTIVKDDSAYGEDEKDGPPWAT